MAEVDRQLTEEPHPADRLLANYQNQNAHEGFDISAWKQADIIAAYEQVNENVHPADQKFSSTQYTIDTDGPDLSIWKLYDMAQVSEQLMDSSVLFSDWISWLSSDGKHYLGYGRSASKFVGILKASGEVSIEEIDGTLRIFGPRSARSTLNWQKMTNWLRPENEAKLFLYPSDSALKSLTTGGLAVSLGLNFVADSAKFINGEYDQFEYAAALTVDTGFSIAVAAAAGALAGAVSGYVAGLVGGSVAVPVVGAVPGSVIAGTAGAVAGLMLGIAAGIYITSNGRKDLVVDAVADLYRNWSDTIASSTANSSQVVP